MLICDNETLARFCDAVRDAPYLAVDTEFMGDKTFYPQLCLIQVAHGEHAAAVDTLAPGLDLAPLAELFARQEIVKVMHAGRQDQQILRRTLGQVLTPFFDTQVAAAVCGLGDQPGYDKLVFELLEVDIDKSSQATDWSLRPLSERQVDYAISDVTHLCNVYEKLDAQLRESGRGAWVMEEMLALVDLARDEVDPEEMFRRIKVRKPSRRTLAVLRELAAWRERSARERDLPRGWVVRDDALAEIAQNPPRDARALGRVRGIKEATARGADGRALLDGVGKALARPQSEWPQLPPRRAGPKADDSMIALLQALLRVRCNEHGVAGRLVANRDDLERIAGSSDADTPALRGWRRELFGEDAIALREGRLGLTGKDGQVVVHEP